MKLIVLISILTLIRAEEHLGDYVIDGVPHYRETLYTTLKVDTYPHYPLVVDFTTNDLYLDWYQDPASIININTKELRTMTGIPTPQCLTVDQDSHIVYIGTGAGIYKYNGTTQESDRISVFYEDIWRIYYHNGVIYYRKYGDSQTIRTLVNGVYEIIHEFNVEARYFIVDNEENIFCVTRNGSMYRHTKDSKQDFLYEDTPFVQSLTTDKNGTVYFSVEDGIYKVNGDVVERVVTIDNPRYIAFDRDNNIIYYNETDFTIYRLKPVNITNSGSEPHINDKENDNSVISKIDDLAQIILTLQAKVEQLQSDVQQLRVVEERHNVENTPQWIRLETGNIPICRGEAGV